MSDEAKLTINESGVLSSWGLPNDTCVAVEESPNPWARISEVAAKVGVKPVGNAHGKMIAHRADGKPYDVWEVVIAVLDRLEKCS